MSDEEILMSDKRENDLRINEYEKFIKDYQEFQKRSREVQIMAD